MIEVYRKGVPVDACCTLSYAGKRLGGGKNLLHHHKERSTDGFPRPVAKCGAYTLYVFAELEAFYNSVLWRQGDKHIKELQGGDDAWPDFSQ